MSTDGEQIHVVSDLHLEVPEVDCPTERAATMLADLNELTDRDDVGGWCCTGDTTTYSSPAEHAAFIAWWRALKTGTARSAIVPGNHELLGNGRTVDPLVDLVTPAQWAATYAPLGVLAENYVVDIGSRLRLLCLSPSPGASGSQHRLMVDAATLAWCDARIEETSRWCAVLFHAPLMHSVNASPADDRYLSSSEPDWHAHDDGDSTIAAMIARHQNFRAWISGHTHSPVGAPEIVKRMTYGTVSFAAISAGSAHPIGPGPSGSVRVGFFSDRVEVRHRDHEARRWLEPVQVALP